MLVLSCVATAAQTEALCVRRQSAMTGQRTSSFPTFSFGADIICNQTQITLILSLSNLYPSMGPLVSVSIHHLISDDGCRGLTDLGSVPP